MQSKFTRKRAKDAATIALWQRRNDADFARLGVSRTTLEALIVGFQGEIILPWDKDYDKERRLPSPVFDPHPCIILMCVCEHDVALALNLAWGGYPKIPFTLRSGGHSTAGFSAGSGILIDISGLNDVYFDVPGLTVTVGSGCDFARLSPMLDQQGMHLPIGDCPEVGVAGYMQGGGYSFTSRTFGMNCDNVLEVRVMLADGSIVTANATQNLDLFWAIRGGTGGNFGVLLSVKFQIRPLGKIMGFSFIWPLGTPAERATAATALQSLQTDFLSTAPQEMTPQMIFAWQPDAPGSSTLTPSMMCRGTYVGDEQAGLAAIKGIGALPGARFQYAVMDIFSVINEMLLTKPDPLPPFPPLNGPPFEDKQSRYVGNMLALADLRSILDLFAASPNNYSAMCFEIAGGAINAPPLESNAFIHRTAQFNAFLDVFWLTEQDRSAAQAFLKQFSNLFETFWNNEVFQNYPSLDIPDYRANYWGRAFPALAAVKAKYDPKTFFNFAQAAVPYPGGTPAPTWPPAVVAALAQPIATTHAPAQTLPRPLQG